MCECGTSELGGYFGKVGGQFGDMVTNKGYALAGEARKRFKNWTGLGDYKIRGNSLIAGSEGGVPQIQTQNRSTLISFREYLGDVYTHPTDVGAFNLKSFAVNPGNVNTNPWLAPIALQFEQYKPRGIIFEFKTTTADISSTSAVGSLIMMTDYDVLDDPPGNKGEMLNSAYSQESKISYSAVHGLECSPEELQRKVFYTRAASASMTYGPRDYDIGNFHIATQGGNLPVNQSVGSLYIHYEYEFFKEQPNDLAGGGLYMMKRNNTNVTNELGIIVTAMNLATLTSGLDIGLVFAHSDEEEDNWVAGNSELRFPTTLSGKTIFIEIAFVGHAQIWNDFPQVVFDATRQNHVTVREAPQLVIVNEYSDTTGILLNKLTFIVTMDDYMNTYGRVTFNNTNGLQQAIPSWDYCYVRAIELRKDFDVLW